MIYIINMINNYILIINKPTVKNAAKSCIRKTKYRTTRFQRSYLIYALNGYQT